MRNLLFLFGVLIIEVDLRSLDFLADLNLPGVFRFDDVTLFLVRLDAVMVDGRGFLREESDMNVGERADEPGEKKVLI